MRVTALSGQEGAAAALLGSDRLESALRLSLLQEGSALRGPAGLHFPIPPKNPKIAQNSAQLSTPTPPPQSLVKVLELTKALLEGLGEAQYSLTDYEASLLLPCVVEKAGHNQAGARGGAGGAGGRGGRAGRAGGQQLGEGEGGWVLGGSLATRWLYGAEQASNCSRIHL